MQKDIMSITCNLDNHSEISKNVNKILHLISKILTNEILHPDINTCLNELDIKISLSTIHALLQDLEPILLQCGSSIIVCILHLKQTISDIEMLLNLTKIKNKHYKKNCWSCIYKNVNMSQEIKQIKNLNKILKYRIDLLTKSLAIQIELINLLNINNDNKKNS